MKLRYKILLSIISVGFIYAIVCLSLILSIPSSIQKTTGYQTILVEGCRMEGKDVAHSYPSKTTKARLKVALELNKKNPKAKIVVSGGQVRDEKYAEADGMKKYLVDHGISSNQIIAENKSQTTYENQKNSKKYLKGQTALITNRFHIWRSLYLTRVLGLKNVTGCPAKETNSLVENGYNYAREILAVGYSLIFIH